MPRRDACEPCSHCGDLVGIDGWCPLCSLTLHRCCRECHQEIEHGEISLQSVHFTSGNDFSSAYWGSGDNGVRALEDAPEILDDPGQG